MVLTTSIWEQNPGISKPKTICEEALKAIQREVVEICAQSCHNESPENQTLIDISPGYRKLLIGKQAFNLDSEDLCPLLEKN